VAGAAGLSGAAGSHDAGGAGGSGTSGAAGAIGIGGVSGSGGGLGAAGTAGGGAAPEVDATEVTRAAYQAWLDTAPTGAGRPPECVDNASFVPTCLWPPGTAADYPVVCVDWCDAQAYCADTGRRLCGRIGGGPTPFSGSSYQDASISQWYRACTSNGTFPTPPGTASYPYGDTYGATTCNGASRLGDSAPVASFPDCRSPVPGYDDVYDLSGNAWEWEDSCEAATGMSDMCRMRGGGWGSVRADLTCQVDGQLPRSSTAGELGFRCCTK